MNTNYIDIQLLRVVAPGLNTGTNTAYMYNNKNKSTHNPDYCCQDQFLVRTHGLCYLMETRNINVCLWNRNIELRENGVLPMGTIIRILAPPPSITYVAGNIPKLES